MPDDWERHDWERQDRECHDWERLQEPGLVHVVVTARDANSAYRVFDALVDRFPAVDPPAWLTAPPGLVAFAVLTPTRAADRG